MKLLRKSVAGWLAAGALALAGATAIVNLGQQQSAQAQQVTANPAPAPKGWAKDLGDLPHDKDYILGTLPNGMRYLILQNYTPPRQVALRLMIDAGSMQERPGEEGIAHFLEHLSFRGTRDYPDGEIQRVMENFGLQMGDDVNASTGPDRTVFQFDLARNDAASVDAGLNILRNIASELNLSKDTIDVERGVVLAEERMRAGPELESQKALLKLQLGDHPYGRSPIGFRKVIETVTADQVRGFYDAYYRPERAILMIVGDVRPDNIVQQINSRFGDWKGRGAPGKDPAPVMTKPVTPEVVSLVTDGSPDTSVMLRWFEPYRNSPPTKAELRRGLVENLGAGIVARRMQGINEAAGKPAARLGSASSAQISGVWNGEIAMSLGVTDVPKAIDLMVKAQRQAVDFGITQGELDRQIQLMLEASKREAERGRTGTSVSLVEDAVNTVAADAPFMSLQDTYALLQELIPTITLAEVNKSLKTRFADKPVLIYQGSEPPKGGEQALKTAYAGAMAAKVKAYVPDAVKPWPYTNFGTPGEVAERKTITDLNVTLVTFKNGVKLTIKPLPTNKDLISVRVRVGLGRLQMPMNVIDASDMGLSLWSSGGLGKLTPTEMARTLAGKRAVSVARTLDDAYALDNINVTTREDLGLQMQLMTAMLTDSAYRADDWASWMQQSDAADLTLGMTPSGALERDLDALIHDGDLRWTINNKKLRDTWKSADSIKYIKPIVDKSPIEVIVVGDVGVEAVIAEVSKTMGALPPRPPFVEPKGWRDVKFPKPGVKTITHKGRVDQGYALIGWPTYQGEYKNLRDSRIGYVLGQMIRDNATREFRSKGGATYSPDSNVDFSRFLPDYGYVSVAVEVAPNTIDSVLAQMQTIASDLAIKPVDPSEINRIVAPRIELTRRNIVTNVNYWMEYLANAHTDGMGMQAIRSELTDFQSITPADIQAAAKKWLTPEKAWKLRVVPTSAPQ